MLWSRAAPRTTLHCSPPHDPAPLPPFASHLRYGLGFLEQQGLLVKATLKSPRAAAHLLASAVARQLATGVERCVRIVREQGLDVASPVPGGLSGDWKNGQYP